MHLKASSAVIVPSTSFTVKACHSRKKENALSFDQVEQMLNFMRVFSTIFFFGKLSVACRLAVGKLSVMCRPTVDRQSTDRFFGELFFTITVI